jgi:hypothetical protein
MSLLFPNNNVKSPLFKSDYKPFVCIQLFIIHGTFPRILRSIFLEVSVVSWWIRKDADLTEECQEVTRGQNLASSSVGKNSGLLKYAPLFCSYHTDFSWPHPFFFVIELWELGCRFFTLLCLSIKANLEVFPKHIDKEEFSSLKHLFE